MKLKKYIDFIKESVEESKKSIWNMSKEDIEELFLESTDEGYFLEIEFGFVEKGNMTTKLGSNVGKDVFTDKVLAGEYKRPAIFIKIFSGDKITDEDVTSNLKFAVSYISVEANTDIGIYDSSSELELDRIRIKGGLWIDESSIGGDSDIGADDYIALFVKQKEEVKLTEKDIIDYYNIKIDENTELRGDKVFLHVSIEDMADILLSSKSSYKDVLVKGPIDDFWDNYYSVDYEQDINSLFSYVFDKETKELLAKSLIKEFGGFEEVKKWEKNSVTSAKNSFPKDFQTEEELVEFFVNERFNELLKKWIKTEFNDSDVWRDVTSAVAQAECDAHAYQNYKDIVQAFDRVVSNDIGSFEKTTKEITKHYFITNKEGEKEKKEYKVEMTYYILPYTNDWLESVDADSINSKSLRTLLVEWGDESYFRNELDPYFSDYGHVDNKQLNEEIISELKRYLEKGNTGLR
jgi:hypothetical protein